MKYNEQELGTYIYSSQSKRYTKAKQLCSKKFKKKM